MAGRPRSIDRNKVLDAAEALVLENGAVGLSFEAVARAAGITKSGVQYCFGTRDALIRAMIDRWGAAFDADVAARTGPNPSPAQLVEAHLRATRDEDAAGHSRSAAMMTAVMQHPDQIQASRDWYMQRVAPLDLRQPQDLRVALAFFAGEGAFLMKAFGLVELDDEAWQRLFAAILELAPGPGSAEPA